MSNAVVNGLAGAGAGIVAQIITYPLQTVCLSTRSLSITWSAPPFLIGWGWCSNLCRSIPGSRRRGWPRRASQAPAPTRTAGRRPRRGAPSCRCCGWCRPRGGEGCTVALSRLCSALLRRRWLGGLIDWWLVWLVSGLKIVAFVVAGDLLLLLPGVQEQGGGDCGCSEEERPGWWQCGDVLMACGGGGCWVGSCQLKVSEIPIQMFCRLLLTLDFVFLLFQVAECVVNKPYLGACYENAGMPLAACHVGMLICYGNNLYAAPCANMDSNSIYRPSSNWIR